MSDDEMTKAVSDLTDILERVVAERVNDFHQQGAPGPLLATVLGDLGGRLIYVAARYDAHKAVDDILSIGLAYAGKALDMLEVMDPTAPSVGALDQAAALLRERLPHVIEQVAR